MKVRLPICCLYTSMSFTSKEIEDSSDSNLYLFKRSLVKFGLDSCSIIHVYNDNRLIVPEILREVPNLGIDRIGGTLEVTKLECIKLLITNDNRENSNIILKTFFIFLVSLRL